MLCWSPEDAAGLRCKPCGSINKVYFTTSGDAFLCNYMPMVRPMGNLQNDPLDRILENRDVRLVETRTGHSVPSGCPQWVS